jgi:hypothetical protein
MVLLAYNVVGGYSIRALTSVDHRCNKFPSEACLEKSRAWRDTLHRLAGYRVGTTSQVFRIGGDLQE